jgi:hypothetical protein
MSSEEIPRHALFIRFRHFEAGAFGIPAIVVFALIAALGFVWLRGIWW